MNAPTPPNSLDLKFDDSFYKKFVRLLFVLGGIFVIVQLLPSLGGVITTVVIALLITSVLDPIVSTLENNGLNRVGAILLVFLLLSVLLAGIIYYSSPLITRQIEELSATVNQGSPTRIFDNYIHDVSEKIPILNHPQIKAKFSEKLQSLSSEVVQISFAMAMTVLTSMPYVVIIAFSVFFFLKDGWRIKRAIIEAMPNRYFEISLLLMHRITSQLGRYIQGQFVVSAVVGTLSIIALTLLGIPYSLFIGLIAGIANMIPYFGPLLGFLLAAAAALISQPGIGTVLSIAAAFAIIQLIDNILISPFIVSRSVELHPLAIIIVILIGNALLGIWGMLLAVPVASIIKVTVRSIRWGLKNYRLKERAVFQGS